MPSLLSAEHIALVDGGVSAIVASRDAQLRPSVMRAVAARIGADGLCVTVYLRPSQSRQLLADIRATGHIAVVFSDPPTNRTLQVKATAARLRPAEPCDQTVLRRYLAAMQHAVGLLGYGPGYVAAMLAAPPHDLVAVEFTPEAAFDQTPGPRAGAALQPAAAQPTLGSIRACLEGAIPAMAATCAPDGTPNVAYLSQVVYVDEGHVALSFQFFNKTRANILANPCATVLVLDPVTAQYYRLHLRYLRTETAGPLFERMRAQLAGIATHEGMADVFVLKGSDIYALERLEAVPGEGLAPPPQPRADLLGAVRLCSQRLARCAALDELLQAALAGLHEHLGVQHAMVLMLDAAAGHLYTVASHGYPQSGVGAEVRLGQGVIGVAAREATPVRIGHVTHAALYSHAVRSSLEAAGAAAGPGIPYPGLAAPHSQLAVPLTSAGRTLGVLFAESPLDLQFGYPEEDAFTALAGQLAAAIDLLQSTPEPAADAAQAAPAAPPAGGPLLRVRHFTANDSVFIGDDYLIKDVAGAIFAKLLRDHACTGRVDFTNRELRLDPRIRLPDVADNLEARLLLLQRRLQESASAIRIEKTGRGRFRLCLGRPVALEEAVR